MNYTCDDVLRIWRGIPGSDIAAAMKEATPGIDWSRSPKANMAREFTSDYRYGGVRPGHTPETVAEAAHRRERTRDEYKAASAAADSARDADISRLQRQLLRAQDPGTDANALARLLARVSDTDPVFSESRVLRLRIIERCRGRLQGVTSGSRK